MLELDHLDALYVLTAFLFQIVLVVHFTLRKWSFETAIHYGPIVYALSIPALAVSIALLLGGKSWSLYLGGLLYIIWATYGYVVEYVKNMEWRDPIRWSIFVPYVVLYLSTVMFYWFPLALIHKPLWYAGAVLFIIATLLNTTSHKGINLRGHRSNEKR